MATYKVTDETRRNPDGTYTRVVRDGHGNVTVVSADTRESVEGMHVVAEPGGYVSIAGADDADMPADESWIDDFDAEMRKFDAEMRQFEDEMERFGDEMSRIGDGIGHGGINAGRIADRASRLARRYGGAHAPWLSHKAHGGKGGSDSGDEASAGAASRSGMAPADAVAADSLQAGSAAAPSRSDGRHAHMAGAMSRKELAAWLALGISIGCMVAVAVLVLVGAIQL